MKYLLKYNALKLKNHLDKRAYNRVIKEMGKQLENQEEEVNYFRDKYDMLLKTRRKLQERIKELESKEIINEKTI